MKNRFVDIPALFKRQERKGRSWIAQWGPTIPENMSLHERYLRQYLAGEKGVVHLGDYLGYFQTDYLQSFVYSALVENHLYWERFAAATRYGLASILVNDSYLKSLENPRRGIFSVSLSDLALTIDFLLMANWRPALDFLYGVIRAGIDGPFIDWEDYYAPHAQFFIDLLADFMGEPLDRSIYGITAKYFDSSAYEMVLEQWRSPDPEVVGQLVQRLADTHVANGTGEDSAFSFSSDWLFPHEILAFLRLREWAGLPNPTTFEHPLMHTPLAVFPPETLPWPEVPLLEEAIAKFRQDIPEQNNFDRFPAQPV